MTRACAGAPADAPFAAAVVMAVQLFPNRPESMISIFLRDNCDLEKVGGCVWEGRGD